MAINIAYICDGKLDCSNHENCHYHNHHGECRRTVKENHAKYGECAGKPSWYPERFYEISKDKWVEKERY